MNAKAFCQPLEGFHSWRVLKLWGILLLLFLFMLMCNGCALAITTSGYIGNRAISSYSYKNNEIHHEYAASLGKVYEVAKDVPDGFRSARLVSTSLGDERATIEATFNDGRKVRIYLESKSNNRTCATFSVGTEESYDNRTYAVILALDVRNRLGLRGSDLPGGPTIAGCPTPPNT